MIFETILLIMKLFIFMEMVEVNLLFLHVERNKLDIN
jgi:hypothetical protein